MPVPQFCRTQNVDQWAAEVAAGVTHGGPMTARERSVCADQALAAAGLPVDSGLRPAILAAL